ncbi:MAG TPA: tripartite tricarboxylate transporter substrate binding protein [Burkholderiales bacterium]|nr:tripartite tricarboxylate transporter substrate binding protein [Burkholderiales bacterium]
MCRIAAVCVAAAWLAFCSQAASAQQYPTKPIRILVGPGPDALARVYGQKFTDAWGQQVVIDQRPGAGGTIAAETVAKAAPDGYTLLLATGSYTINASLQQQPYDLVRDFAAISLLGTVPFILVVHPAVPAKTVPELVQLAKAKPGQINYASAGNGTPPHLAGEMLKMMTGISLVHVPYKGAAQGLTDVMAGQIQMMFAVGPVGIPQVQSGKVRGLAVSTAKRSRIVPDLPTVAESGVPGFEVVGWNGLLAPAGSPQAALAKLYGEIAKATALSGTCRHASSASASSR